MGNASCAQALATRNCSACASDAAASKVAVVANAAHSEDLYIYSHSKVCERKTTGGDAWVVEVRGWDFHHGQSQEKVRALKMVWRAPAKDLGDGRYVAHLPHLLFETGLAVGVSVSLWWTRADPSWSLEHSWNQVRPQNSSTLYVAHITDMVTPAPTMPLRFLLTEWYAHCADVKSSCLPAPLRHIADARLDLGCPISELPRLRPCAAESAPRAQVHHTRGAGAAGAAPSAVSFRGGPAALYCGHRRNLQATRARPAAAWWMVISLPLAIRLATRPTARRHTSPQCAESQHGWDGRFFRV